MRPHQPTGRPVRRRAALAAFAALPFLPSPAHAVGKLELFPDPFLLVVLLVVFLVLVPPVNALIFKPLFRVLDERQDGIEGARRRAEEVEKKTEEMLARYQAAIRQVRAEAEGDRRSRVDAARAEHAQATGAARSEAEREIDGARKQLADSLGAAHETLRAGAQELAREAAGRILGRELQ